MAKATFRSFIGIARELGRTTVSSAIGNAGATSIALVDATGFSATSKVTIYDGANTEVVTASALVGSTLTVSATLNAHTTPGLLVTTVGTASAGPTDYLPVTKFDPADNQTFAEDKAWRGSLGDINDLVAGPRSAAMDFSGPLYCDTFGYLLGGLLGDVVFGAGTPNTHTFSALNSGTGQAPSYQLTDFYGANTRQWGGVQFSDIDLKATGDGLVTWDCKGLSYASGVVATPTSSYSAVRATPGYAGITTVGGTVLSGPAGLKSIDLSIKRAVELIPCIDGGPDPLRVWDGLVGVTGKATYVVDDDTFLNYYLNNTQPALDIAWNIGTGAAQLGLTLHLSSAAHHVAKTMRGQAYVTTEADLIGVANTTDAGASGGRSPIKCTLRNAKISGTYG